MMNNVNTILTAQVKLDQMIYDAKQRFEEDKTFSSIKNTNYGDIDKNFWGNIWYKQNDSNKRGVYIVFEDYERMDCLSYEDCIYIRCFFAFYGSDVSASILRRYERLLKKIFLFTNNFSDEKNVASQIITLINSISIDNAVLLKAVLAYYLEYLMKYELITNAHIAAYQAIRNLRIKRTHEIHELPTSASIHEFSYYLQDFFDNCSSENLKLYYMPILIWWKLTTIIPMRISEFTYRLSPNCYYREGDNHYIHIKRSKTGEKEGSRHGKLPQITDYLITKDIYELLEKYSDSVSFDSTRDTYLSKRAQNAYGNKYYYEEKNFLELPTKLPSEFTLQRNHVENSLNSYDYKDFNNLLVSFYRNIITHYYKCEVSNDQWLSGNDTRYLALMSLLLQGVSPIDMALMAGHITLTSQWAYIGAQDFYIDAEILKYISSTTFTNSSQLITLKGIVLNMPTTPPVILADAMPADDNIGYCTLKNPTPEQVQECAECELCVFCPHYWCYPDNETYTELKKFINNSVLNKKNMKLTTDIQTFKKIFDTAPQNSFVGTDLPVFPASIDRQLKQLSRQIEATTSDIINLKKYLIDSFPGISKKKFCDNGKQHN